MSIYLAGMRKLLPWFFYFVVWLQVWLPNMMVRKASGVDQHYATSDVPRFPPKVLAFIESQKFKEVISFKELSQWFSYSQITYETIPRERAPY